jgi:hypothetical protein
MRTLGCVACVALAACKFSPPIEGAPGDGPTGSEPKPPGDGSDTPPDARLCFGIGLGMVCLMNAPTMPRTLTANIDTSTAGNCTEVIAVGGVMSCVIAGTTVQVPTGSNIRGIGSRPLVIVASETLTIEGSLSVGSTRTGGPGGSPIVGAGAPSPQCMTPTPPEDDDGGGGGGAGGSFAGPGGNGGTGDLNDPIFGGTANGGVHSAELTQITTLRAGCRGGNGGDGSGPGDSFGTGGPGGGALYLIAGTQIVINGAVSAFGAGGVGGFAGGGGGGMNPERGGGGGGGSGGMVGLDAPTVTVAASGSVTANGGGGGEGCGLNGPRCDPGDDGTTNGTRAAGGIDPIDDNAGDDDGGNGGLGSGGSVLAGAAGASHDGGGGGGGGGAGFIYVKGAFTANGATISPTATVTP